MRLIDLQIREAIVRYLAEEISIQDFKDGFVPVAWQIEETNNRIAIELAHEIELILAEYGNGDWTEDEVRNGLRPFIQSYNVNISAPSSISTSIGSITTATLGSPLRSYDIKSEVVYV